MLGFSEHARRFAENDIDFLVHRHLTDQDLKELGLSLGHRRKMLRGYCRDHGYRSQHASADHRAPAQAAR
jgi:hypothetical protein